MSREVWALKLQYPDNYPKQYDKLFIVSHLDSDYIHIFCWDPQLKVYSVIWTPDMNIILLMNYN